MGTILVYRICRGYINCPQGRSSHIYDLDQDKHQELSCMPTTRKSKALHVAFNPTGPYILVGDESGGVISFKLPSSLSQGPLTPDPKDENMKGQSIYTLEKAKMNKYLST